MTVPTGGKTTARATVLTDSQIPVRVLTLNRPDRRNAIDLVLRVELAEAIAEAMADPQVRAIVLTGAGGSFCSGGDISTMQRLPPEQGRPRSEAAQRVTFEIWSGRKPVVAAVEGAAVGAGLALALACDRIVAAESATFSASFLRVALAGDMGIFASLPARVGPHRAKQMMLFAERLDAAQAQSAGLVDVLTADGTALDRALADARALAAGPARAIATIKQSLNAWPRDPFTILEAEIDAQAALFDSDDFAEAIAAFQGKRVPEFGRHPSPSRRAAGDAGTDDLTKDDLTKG